MSLSLPGPQGCCTPACTEPIIVDIPGTPGTSGNNGTNGADGIDAFTFTTASFTVPAELGTVTIAVTNSMWSAIGQVLFIPGAGYYQITALPNSISMTIQNLKDTPNLAYMGNAVPTTVVASNSKVSPAGIQGASFPTQLLNGAGPPAAPPTNVNAPAYYWDKTNKAAWNWNDTLAVWE